MSNAPYDICIVGSGPAGATAAIFLARHKHRVALIDRDTFPRKAATAGWLNAHAAPLLEALGVNAKSLLSRAFVDVTFHNADFSKSARPNFKKAPGYLIDRAQLDNALVKTARSAGVDLLAGAAATRIRLKESVICVERGGSEPIEGRLLLVAAGRGTMLLDHVGLGRGAAGATIWAAQVDLDVKTPSAKSEPRVNVVLGLDRRGSFALLCVTGDCTSAAINWYGDRADAGAAFVNVCRLAAAHGLVPAALVEPAGKAELFRCPASAALDMDTHVGKHTLLIGDAGGFIAAASNEGVYPAMWSAQIAADVVHAALKSVHSQDVLKTFDAEWRMKMADYLRSPNTDPQFLVPLIFSNQPMADRMGAAFFSGENI